MRLFAHQWLGQVSFRAYEYALWMQTCYATQQASSDLSNMFSRYPARRAQRRKGARGQRVNFVSKDSNISTVAGWPLRALVSISTYLRWLRQLKIHLGRAKWSQLKKMHNEPCAC